jgi:hypothetical protein
MTNEYIQSPAWGRDGTLVAAAMGFVETWSLTTVGSGGMVTVRAAVYHTMGSGALIYIREDWGETGFCISCDVDGNVVRYF